MARGGAHVSGIVALVLMMASMMAALVRGGRRRFRPLVAAATALAFLSATTAGCGEEDAPRAGHVGNLAAVHYHSDHLGGVALVTGPFRDSRLQ